MQQANVPIVDLQGLTSHSTSQRIELSKQLNTICHEIGFFYIVNHGIEPALCDKFRRMQKRFFELPELQKQKLSKHHSPQFRGWEKLGSELTNNQVDYREQIDIGRERTAIENPDPYYMALIGPNQWPRDNILPGFKDNVLEFIDRLSTLSGQILRLMSLSLGLDENHIQAVFGDQPSPYTKLIRYPPTRPGERGVGVHKDSGFLTLLLQDQQSGLEAQMNNGSWVSVLPIENTLVVNIGELLQLMTQNYFIATPHRVRNDNPTDRYSCAFFYSPDLNTPLDPLPIAPKLLEKVQHSDRHRNEGLMASRAELKHGTDGMASSWRPAVFGEKYWQRWVRSYPDIAKRYYPDKLGAPNS
jgi:isopenicillin N synthase-like dioxygenase